MAKEGMTKEDILTMKLGRELNIKVAQEVMGHKVVGDESFGYMELFTAEDGSTVWGPLQQYSEDMTASELVVGRMISLGYDDAIHWGDSGNGAYSPPEAISKAALLAMSEGC